MDANDVLFNARGYNIEPRNADKRVRVIIEQLVPTILNDMQHIYSILLNDSVKNPNDQLDYKTLFNEQTMNKISSLNKIYASAFEMEPLQTTYTRDEIGYCYTTTRKAIYKLLKDVSVL